MHIVPQSDICVAGKPCAAGLPVCAPGSAVGTPCVGQFFTPQGFQQAYDVGDTATGSRTDIAIIAEGNLSGVITDLRYAEAQNHLPQVPVKIVQVGLASPDVSGADEWDLDTQMSTGMAQTVKTLYIYDTTSLTDSDLALAFNRFAAQDVAKAGSASLGECEAFPYLDGSMLADDEVFLEAAAQGQTMFASSGDTGASCAVAPTNGVPDSGPPMVNYPASSPYVVAVGGTDLFVNKDGSYNRETAWEAGGGGISQLEYSPYWQAVAVPSNAAGDKGIPDVAMDAGLETGALVYINKVAYVIGGTSVSSPLSLGVFARLESARNNKLGFASPNFYHLATGVLHAVPGSTTLPWAAMEPIALPRDGTSRPALEPSTSPRSTLCCYRRPQWTIRAVETSGPAIERIRCRAGLFFVGTRLGTSKQIHNRLGGWWRGVNHIRRASVIESQIY